MSASLTSYPRTSGGGGSDLVRFDTLLQELGAGTAMNMEQAAQQLLDTLDALSAKLGDQDMVVLSVNARNALAIAKVKGQIVGSYFLSAMRTCAKHWMKVYPHIASTGLAPRERQVIADTRAAVTAVAQRAAAEEAGTVAWLYRLSAVLGEDVTATVACNPVAVAGTRYKARSSGGVLQYLECGASYNVNQFVRIELPDPAAPPLIIAGEAKGGASSYGVVRGPAQFMIANGCQNGTIDQRDLLYPLSRAEYMANAKQGTPASNERRLAGEAIIDARNDGVFVYLAVRGTIDVASQTVTSKEDEFKC